MAVICCNEAGSGPAVVCIHCNASTKTALRLATLGYRVKEMLGGMAAWQAEGYEVAVGTTPGKLTAKPVLQRIQ